MSQQLEKFRGIRVIPIAEPKNSPAPKPSRDEPGDTDNTIAWLWFAGAVVFLLAASCVGFDHAFDNAPSLIGILIFLTVIYPFFKDKP